MESIANHNGTTCVVARCGTAQWCGQAYAFCYSGLKRLQDHTAQVAFSYDLKDYTFWSCIDVFSAGPSPDSPGPSPKGPIKPPMY